MIKVSILVPVYNVENCIHLCATSLFEQTYHNIEYVFVDDASPDKSITILKDIIKRYPHREKDVKIITHEKNWGLAVVRNTAITNATGDYIFIVDSDDYIEKQTIEWMVEKQEETDADIIIGDFFLHSEKGIEKIDFPRLKKKEDLILYMLGTDTFHTVWNKLMRRSLYVNNNIIVKEECNIGEDQIQMVQTTYFAKNFAFIDHFTYHYNCLNPTSIWNSAIRNITEESASQLMKSFAVVKSFFQDKEKMYFQKTAASEFHFFFFCLSNLCNGKQKKAYYNILQKFYPKDDSLWPLNKQQKTLYKIAFSNYYFMSVFLWIKNIKNSYWQSKT